MKPRAWLDIGIRLIGVWLAVQGVSHSLLATGESSVAHLLAGIFSVAVGYYLITGAPLLITLIEATPMAGAEEEKASPESSPAKPKPMAKAATESADEIASVKPAGYRGIWPET